jgi:multimeric flavodoxin WrbA
MSKLLIVYHSKTGGSRQMAEAAAVAAEKEVDTVLKVARDAEPDDLLQADGYIFCAPENLAAIAGIMKDFFDRCYYPVLGRIEGRPYAQMVCAGVRRRKRSAPISAYCSRVAPSGSATASHHLHSCPNTGGNSGWQKDSGRATRSLS